MPVSSTSRSGPSRKQPTRRHSPAPSSSTRAARSLAGAESFNNNYALIALDQTCTDGGLALSPNENIHLIGGGALINSCGANAVTGADPTQDFSITPAGFSVDVVGGVGGNFPAGITVNTGIAPVPDPFAGVYPKPSVSGLPVNPPFVGGVAYSGVYTTTLDGVNLCGGIYILKGNGMDGDIGRQLTGTDPMNGNPATIVGGQLIANRLDIQNGNLNITYSANNSAQPVVPRLAE